MLVLLAVWYGASGLHNGFTRSSLGPFIGDDDALPAAVVTASFLQLAVSGFCAGVALFRRGVSANGEMRQTQTWLLGLLHYLTTVVTNAAYAGATVAVAQTIKAVEPLFVLVLSWVFMSKRLPTNLALTELCAVLLLCCGVVLLVKPPSDEGPSQGDAAFANAVWLGLASNLLNGLRAILFKVASSKSTVGAMAVSHTMNVASVLLSIPPFFFYSICSPSLVSHTLSGAGMSLSPFVLLSFVAGACLFIYNQASFWVLSFIAPTSHSVLKALKRPVIVFGCILLVPFLGPQLQGATPAMVAMGLLLLFGGAGMQAYVAIKQAELQAPSSVAEAVELRAIKVGGDISEKE